MRIRVLVTIGAVGVAAFIAAAALYTVGVDDAPPVAGSVQNFTVAGAGLPVPAIAVHAADGTTATFEQYHGKLVVLNFWATWCGPCIRELPSLQRLSQTLPADKARVILLSQDRGGHPRIGPFLKKLGIAIDDSYVDERLAFSRAAGVASLPTTIVIGPDGTERGRLIGHAEWDSPEALALIGHYLQAR